MERVIAELLVNGFAKRLGATPIDKKLFIDALVATDAPDKSEFSVRLPSNTQTITETGGYNYFSLAYVLRNGAALENEMISFEELIERKFKRYGSEEVLLRKLRTDRDVIDLMMKSESQYSMIGVWQANDYDNPDHTLFVMNSPALVIPGVEDNGAITRWEWNNTTYEKEVGSFFRHFKRIGKDEFQMGILGR